jgi:uracil-DNA glycosylase
MGVSEAHSAAPVPERPTLATLREAIPACRACELYAEATQPVMGEGCAVARLRLVGEPPGDREDRGGTRSSGPAGRVLDEALERAGSTGGAYVTNVVKHFRFSLRGRRRIHRTPSTAMADA